jgi:UDP-N-acetylglucosamine 1-carboxyvinyltransferase
MDKFIIRGGRQLRGTVTVGGAKNAAIALMPATLLASGKYHFTNIPELRESRRCRNSSDDGVDIGAGNIPSMNTFRVNKFEAPGT